MNIWGRNTVCVGISIEKKPRRQPYRKDIVNQYQHINSKRCYFWYGTYEQPKILSKEIRTLIISFVQILTLQ